jgi:hypothetical protein
VVGCLVVQITSRWISISMPFLRSGEIISLLDGFLCMGCFVRRMTRSLLAALDVGCIDEAVIEVRYISPGANQCVGGLLVSCIYIS